MKELDVTFVCLYPPEAIMATKRKVKAKPKGVKAWAGVSSGDIHIEIIDDGFGGWGRGRRKSIALFLTRKSARERYEIVRRVLITEI